MQFRPTTNVSSQRTIASTANPICCAPGFSSMGSNSFEIQFLSPMAGYKMIWLQFTEFRGLQFADFLSISTAWVEIASAWRVGWISNLALHHNSIRFVEWVRLGNCGQQCFGIRMKRM